MNERAGIGGVDDCGQTNSPKLFELVVTINLETESTLPAKPKRVQKKEYVPSPEEIVATCAAIQATWTEQERISRINRGPNSKLFRQLDGNG